MFGHILEVYQPTCALYMVGTSNKLVPEMAIEKMKPAAFSPPINHAPSEPKDCTRKPDKLFSRNMEIFHGFDFKTNVFPIELGIPSITSHGHQRRFQRQPSGVIKHGVLAKSQRASSMIFPSEWISQPRLMTPGIKLPVFDAETTIPATRKRTLPKKKI